MPREKQDDVYLWDMPSAAQAVIGFTRNRTFEDYENDLLLRSAVEHQIEIIGEAARKVSLLFREDHAFILWAKIITQRHVLAT